jgi:hypothetical protein
MATHAPIDQPADGGAFAAMSRRRLSTAVIDHELEQMGMSNTEVGAFNRILRPDDIYDPEGTYWSDLPLRKRIGFVNKVNNEEAKREASIVWEMFKKDPLSPFGAYFRNFVVPGMGLGLEG